jgi:hypothetical protein
LLVICFVALFQTVDCQGQNVGDELEEIVDNAIADHVTEALQTPLNTDQITAIALEQVDLGLDCDSTSSTSDPRRLARGRSRSGRQNRPTHTTTPTPADFEDDIVKIVEDIVDNANEGMPTTDQIGSLVDAQHANESDWVRKIACQQVVLALLGPSCGHFDDMPDKTECEASPRGCEQKKFTVLTKMPSGTMKNVAKYQCKPTSSTRVLFGSPAAGEADAAPKSEVVTSETMLS